MDLGGAGAAAAIFIGYLLVGLFGLAVLVAIGLSFWLRRLIVWTPVMAMLTVPLWFTGAWPAAVFGLALWLVVAWPSQRRRAESGAGPLFALAISVAMVIGASVLALMGRSFLQQSQAAKRQAAQRPIARSAEAQPSRPPSSSGSTPRPVVAPAAKPWPPAYAGPVALARIVEPSEAVPAESYVLVGIDQYPGVEPSEMSGSFPVLALRATDKPPPRGAEHPWSYNEVLASPPIERQQLTTVEATNVWLESEIGEGWRVATFDNGRGWKFWAAGEVSADPDQRFWIFLSDPRIGDVP